MDSYSKYLDYPEIRKWLDENVEEGWVDKVAKVKNLLRQGRDASDQINILGDDGVPVSYHETFWKSELIDYTFLQQDAFDATDALTPWDRQKYMLDLVLSICDRSFGFEDFENCRRTFKEIINVIRQMNYSEFKGEAFNKFHNQLDKLLEENGK